MFSKTKPKKIQKISHLSAITMIIGASVGAGIFFKNRELIQMANGSLILVLLAWIIAGFAIICLALSLIRISNIKESNRGILGWTSVYTSRLFHKTAANYKKIFFIPIMIFALSLYITKLLVGAGLAINSNVAVLGIAFLIFCWVIFINIISLRCAEVFQWIITLLKMVPLVIIPIIALINFGNVGEGNTIWNKHLEPITGIAGISKIMVLILGLPSVLFSFVGFHSIATQRDNLQNPQKLGKTLLWGIIIILITYLFLTIAFNVGSSDGTHETIPMPVWAMKIFQICIAGGILSIINGVLMSAVTQWKNMMLLGESSDLVFLHKLLFKNVPENSNLRQQNLTVIIFFFIITSLVFLVFGILGILLLSNPDKPVGSGLYEIADILSNYMALFILLIISTIIFGALIQGKSQKNFINNLSFKILAIISILIFYSSLIFAIVGAIIDATGFNHADASSSVMKTIALFSVLLISVGLGASNLYRDKRKVIVSQLETPEIPSEN